MVRWILVGERKLGRYVAMQADYWALRRQPLQPRAWASFRRKRAIHNDPI